MLFTAAQFYSAAVQRNGPIITLQPLIKQQKREIRFINTWITQTHYSKLLKTYRCGEFRTHLNDSYQRIFKGFLSNYNLKGKFKFRTTKIKFLHFIMELKSKHQTLQATL